MISFRVGALPFLFRISFAAALSLAPDTYSSDPPMTTVHLKGLPFPSQTTLASSHLLVAVAGLSVASLIMAHHHTCC